MGHIWKSLLKEHEVLYWTLMRWGYQYYRLRYPDDEKYIRHYFKKRMGREVILESPQLFADKIQWLKLFWRDPLAEICADKALVRDYVAEKAGDRYLNELYGVYSSADELELSDLPDSFVLKANHGSDWNIICPDKSKLKWETERSKLKIWLKMNYYHKWREWVYKDIEPRILSEKYLGGPEELTDYKFHCRNGEPVSVSACFYQEGRRYINSYTMDWKNMDVEKMENTLEIEQEKPSCFEEMCNLCRMLAEPFPYVRVDLYQVKDQVIFGEMTFFPASGIVDMDPPEYNKVFGDFVDLSQMGGGNE